jgi:putative acetyltransferase
MDSGLCIRPEQEADQAAIGAVTAAAFANHPHSRQTEQFIVDALRRAGVLALSLVAEEQGRVAGHIAFSPVLVAGRECGWYGMGPLSVLPALQRRGTGTALVQVGLDRLRAMGARGCALVGDPAFYARFGFSADHRLTLAHVPPEFFLTLPLADTDATGEVLFHPAFAATE